MSGCWGLFVMCGCVVYFNRPSFVGSLSVPLTKEHLEALNAFVFHRVAVEEVGLVPAALEWVKLEVQLGTAQKRYGVLRRWLDDYESAKLASMLAQEGMFAYCWCSFHGLFAVSLNNCVMPRWHHRRNDDVSDQGFSIATGAFDSNAVPYSACV
jgi:hypothetical protein